MSPRPFTVDSAVMAAIRPMKAIDAPKVAQLRHAAMGNSTWARLGTKFLRALYTALIDDERFLGFVYEEDGLIRGFIAGSQDTDTMLSSTFKRMWPALALAAFPKILNH